MAFVKPAKQGSSVGIHKVTNAEEYEKALDDAFKYDYKILVEQGIDHPQEVEISILGNEHPVASKLGAVRVPEGDSFYNYENKFVDAFFVLPCNIDFPPSFSFILTLLKFSFFFASLLLAPSLFLSS